MDSIEKPVLRAVAQRILQAKYAVAFTGAGISTPSGIPDFRSPGSGLWSLNNPMEVATLTTFRRRPEVFFDWLRPLAERVQNAEPNPAHLGLAKLEEHGLLKAVVTQNIDGLHQRAGSKEVWELHGSTATLTCTHCRKQVRAEVVRERFIEKKQIPLCPDCQKILKPDLILFEEALPEPAWNRSELHMRRADLVLIIGTSLNVFPASSLPSEALEHGAKIIIINLSETCLDEYAEVVLPCDAAECVSSLIEELGL